MRRKNISNSTLDFDSKNKPNSNKENSIKENKLINEIIDLKDAVKINWKILNEYIISNLNNSEDEKDKEDKKEIEDLLKTCKSLIDSNISSIPPNDSSNHEIMAIENNKNEKQQISQNIEKIQKNN